MAEVEEAAAPRSAAPMLMYPEKYHLALKYSEAVLMAGAHADVTESDKLLLDALCKQATHGACNEPRPSMWDAVAKARWTAWKQLGDRSKMEAMFMYVQAVEELEPRWWAWPPLGLCDASEPPPPTGGAVATAADEMRETIAPDPLSPGLDIRISPQTANARQLEPPLPMAALTNGEGAHAEKALAGVRLGRWSVLSSEGAPARYHDVAWN